RRTRPRPSRDPYCPCDNEPGLGSPKRSATVSLSTSNDNSTATRAPFGHSLGCSDRPARTAFTTVRTVSMLQRQPGFTVGGVGCAWARTTDGMSSKMKLLMVNSRESEEIMRGNWSVQKSCHTSIIDQFRHPHNTL